MAADEEAATHFRGTKGQLKLSLDRLAALRPDLAVQTVGCLGMRARTPARELRRVVQGKTVLAWRQRLADSLRDGVCNPAVVLEAGGSGGVVVAAYSADLDAVVLLRFARGQAVAHLKKGERLLSVNTGWRVAYWESGDGASFEPLLADLLSSETAKIERKKADIPEAQWARAIELGEQAMAQCPRWVRDGRPGFSHKPRAEGSKPVQGKAFQRPSEAASEHAEEGAARSAGYGGGEDLDAGSDEEQSGLYEQQRRRPSRAGRTPAAQRTAARIAGTPLASSTVSFARRAASRRAASRTAMLQGRLVPNIVEIAIPSSEDESEASDQELPINLDDVQAALGLHKDADMTGTQVDGAETHHSTTLAP